MKKRNNNPNNSSPSRINTSKAKRQKLKNYVKQLNVLLLLQQEVTRQMSRIIEI
jgi:hypothetical protein